MSTTENASETLNINTTVEGQAKLDETHVISPKSQDARDRLEKQLKERPERSELIEKNILKGGNAAPALQAAQESLKRAQLEDKLDHALQARPNPEELVREGILLKDEVPPS